MPPPRTPSGRSARCFSICWPGCWSPIVRFGFWSTSNTRCRKTTRLPTWWRSTTIRISTSRAGHRLSRRVLPDLLAMLEAARIDGIELMVVFRLPLLRLPGRALPAARGPARPRGGGSGVGAPRPLPASVGHRGRFRLDFRGIWRDRQRPLGGAARLAIRILPVLPARRDRTHRLQLRTVALPPTSGASVPAWNASSSADSSNRSWSSSPTGRRGSPNAGAPPRSSATDQPVMRASCAAEMAMAPARTTRGGETVASTTVDGCAAAGGPS